MKNNNLNDKQLNNLFEQIKKSEPLITRDESVEIVKNINTFGVKKMIGIGITMAAVAAFIATGIFFPFEEENIQNDENNQVNVEQKADEQTEILPIKELEDQPRDENLLTKKDEQEKEDKSTKSEEFKRELNKKKNAEKLVQINSIPLTVNAWKELGFVSENNELRFSAFENTPENSLIILGENDYNMEMSSEEIVQNKIFPAFVSNEKGERIISLFANASDGLQMTKMVKSDGKKVEEEDEKEEYPKIKYELNENGEKEIVFPIKLNKMDINTDDLKDSNRRIGIYSIINNYIEADTLIFSDKSDPDSPKRKIIFHDEEKDSNIKEKKNEEVVLSNLKWTINNKNEETGENEKIVIQHTKPIIFEAGTQLDSNNIVEMISQKMEENNRSIDADTEYSSIFSRQKVIVIDEDGKKSEEEIEVEMQAPVGTKFILEQNSDKTKKSKQFIVEYKNDEWNERKVTDRDDLNTLKLLYRTNDDGEKENLYYTDEDVTKLIQEASYVKVFVADSNYKYTPDPSKASNTFLLDNNNIIFSTIDNPDAPERAIFIHDENNTKKTKKTLFQTHDINKLIPMSVELGKKKYILWFSPTDNFVRAIPRGLQEILRPEIEAIRSDETAKCGGTDFGEEAVMDVWKGCSGAIQNMKIYPNPATTSSNIEFDLDEKRQINITIVDLSGHIIKQISSGESVNPGQIERAISLENISPGMYYVKITSEIGEQALQRIIVN